MNLGGIPLLPTLRLNQGQVKIDYNNPRLINSKLKLYDPKSIQVLSHAYSPVPQVVEHGLVISQSRNSYTIYMLRFELFNSRAKSVINLTLFSRTNLKVFASFII